jgi:hypothetical protein
VTKKFIKKNIALTLELDDYLTKHPDLYEAIPDGATLVITLKSDKKFTEDSISIVMSHNPTQPIIKAEKEHSSWTLSPLILATA